jgi:hypothetical protein
MTVSEIALNLSLGFFNPLSIVSYLGFREWARWRAFRWWGFRPPMHGVDWERAEFRQIVRERMTHLLEPIESGVDDMIEANVDFIERIFAEQEERWKTGRYSAIEYLAAIGTGAAWQFETFEVEDAPYPEFVDRALSVVEQNLFLANEDALIPATLY